MAFEQAQPQPAAASQPYYKISFTRRDRTPANSYHQREDAFESPEGGSNQEQPAEETNADNLDSARGARVERAGEEAAQIANAVKQAAGGIESTVRKELGAMDQDMKNQVTR